MRLSNRSRIPIYNFVLTLINVLIVIGLAGFILEKTRLAMFGNESILFVLLPVVFIILGGKKEGSKAWAAQKANILNVALTRAKKKVYIIGDYNKWKNLNYFNTATDILKRYKFN
jgi:hypothetical protein